MKRMWIILSFWLPAVAFAGWQNPVNIGHPINTDSNDWYPVIAHDGSFMIFVSDRPEGYGSSDLWITTTDGEHWDTPRNLGPQVNTPYCESAPYLALGDSVLYFASMAPGGEGGMDICWCALTNGIAGPRQDFGTPVNSGALDCCPVITGENSPVYFCSTRAGGYGSMDVWMSSHTASGWSDPVNLGSAVNSPSTDCPRWVSDDGATMLICSTRGEGYGDADMWFSTRAGGAWQPVVNLGTVLNTPAAEWGASFLHNGGGIGGTVFFGSGRPGGEGGWDIWHAEELADAEAPSPAPGIGLSLFPNPSRTGATITYVLEEPSRVIVAVYDMQGRLARLLTDRHSEPGRYCTRWDGTSESGVALSAGGYCCSVTAGGCTCTQPLLVAK